MAVAKDDPAQRAASRFVHDQSKELALRAIKRSAQGLGDEALDDPLPSELQRDLHTNANKLYRWGTTDSRRVCCDAQLAKIRRELQQFLPSLLQIGKIRSLALAQRVTAPKKQKISETMSISIGANGEEVFQRMDIITWPEGFEILTRTWVITGSFEVYKDKSNTERVLICEWAQVEFYRFEFVRVSATTGRSTRMRR